jgi:hypothetical protein
MVKWIDSISAGVPKALVEIVALGRTLKKRAADVLAYFDRPGTSNGPAEVINGRLEHLRGSALEFRNLTNYIARSLLEAGGVQAPTPTPSAVKRPQPAASAARASLVSSTEKRSGCQSWGSQSRISSAPSPMGVARVVAAGNPSGDLLVAAQAAAVLRRAGHLALQAGRSRWRVVENLFDHQHVLPSVAEVVVIEEPVALGGHHLVEPYLVFGDAFVAFAEVEPGDEVGAGTSVHPDAELVQVAVLPAHRDLQHDMQLVEHQLTGQVETTPDRRLGLHQIDPHPEAPRTLRRHPHLRRRLIEHPREHVPVGVRHQLLQQGHIRTGPGHAALPLPLFLRHAPSLPDRSIAARDRRLDTNYTLDREEPV